MVGICLWLNALQTESAQLVQLFCRKKVGEAILELYPSWRNMRSFFFFCNLHLKLYPCKALYSCWHPQLLKQSCFWPQFNTKREWPRSRHTIPVSAEVRPICQEAKGRAIGSHPIVWLTPVCGLDPITGLGSHTGITRHLHPPLTALRSRTTAFTAVLLTGSHTGVGLTQSTPKRSCRISLIVHWFGQVSWQEPD